MAGNSEKTVRGRPFKPGQSGNPNGRPKIPDDVKAMLKDLGPEAIAYMASVMHDPDEKTINRLDAARELANRAYGKPTQAQDIALDVSGALDVTREIRRVALELENDRRGSESTT